MRRKISYTLYIALVSFLILFIRSARWMTKNFNGVDIRAALFQLNTPMKGTGHELVYAYIKECAIMTIVIVLSGGMFVCALRKMLAYLSLKWTFSFFQKSKSIEIHHDEEHPAVPFMEIIILIILIVLTVRWGNRVGIPAYIKSNMSDNTYLEENFVDPRDVSISFPENKKNLVFIYLESMESTYASVDAGGGMPVNYIPNLTELADSNLCFSNNENEYGGYNWYGLSGWTMAAILSSTSGAPYLIPVIEDDGGEYKDLLPNLYTLGDILKANGYRNYFMCGSDVEFGARGAYYRSHGDYTIYDYYSAIDDGIIPSDYYEFWGMEDKYLYQYAKDKLSEISGKDEPFNFTMLTVDTHHMDGYVCSLCENEYDNQYGNVISCADRQINDFMSWMSDQEWYDDTAVIIVGDHCSMNNNFWDQMATGYERSIYNCFINPYNDKVPLGTTGREVTSMDLFPTTLGALGVSIEGNRLGLGTNLFSDTPTLQERDGRDFFDSQSMSYSAYFYRKYVMGID